MHAAPHPMSCRPLGHSGRKRCRRAAINIQVVAHAYSAFRCTFPCVHVQACCDHFTLIVSGFKLARVVSAVSWASVAAIVHQMYHSLTELKCWDGAGGCISAPTLGQRGGPVRQLASSQPHHSTSNCCNWRPSSCCFCSHLSVSLARRSVHGHLLSRWSQPFSYKLAGLGKGRWAPGQMCCLWCRQRRAPFIPIFQAFLELQCVSYCFCQSHVRMVMKSHPLLFLLISGPRHLSTSVCGAHKAV
jgi:hypothetical protein